MLINPLKSGNHNDIALFELRANTRAINLFYPRFSMRLTGTNLYLITRERSRANAPLFQGHAEQRDGNLLTGRQQYVHLPGSWILHDLLGEIRQAIGLAAHRRKHYHYVIAVFTQFSNALGYCLDSLYGTHRGATEL